jgi:[acyl-carrier-protein] S-malonyltransferase
VQVLAFALPDSGAVPGGSALAWRDHPSWELVDAASELAGFDVGALLDDPVARQGPLERSHLCAFVTGLVAVDAAERLGIAPMAVSGYGVGEYTALVAAGVLGFEDGVRLVLDRAGAVARHADGLECSVATVTGLEDDDVEAACARADGDVSVAGYDAPGEVIVAGTTEGVERAMVVARGFGATGTTRRTTSAALHTALVGPSRDLLRKALADATFSESETLVVANVDARAHLDASEWPGLLSSQLCAPVRWRQTASMLFAEGVRTFVELGGDGALASSTRRSIPQRAAQVHAVATPHDLESLVDRLISTPSMRRTEPVDHAQHASRLLVAPAAGQFRPADALSHAAPRLAGIGASEDDPAAVGIEVGDLIGWVGDVEVRSAFSGTLGGLLVIDGERVMPSQPVAWLHADSAA